MNADDLKYSQAYVDAQQDEIERLRGYHKVMHKIIEDQQTKIERLLGEAERRSRVEDERSQRAVEMEMEIERLRMEVTKVGVGSYNPALVLEERDAEIERLRHDNGRLRAALIGQEVGLQSEIDRLRGLVGLESADLDLDWNRLRSGDRRALIADHQDVFDMVMAKEDEIERLRTSVADFKEAAEAAHRATDNRNEEIERLRDHIKFLNSFRPDAELARLRGLLAECDGYLDYAELNLKQRVREALGE